MSNRYRYFRIFACMLTVIAVTVLAAAESRAELLHPDDVGWDQTWISAGVDGDVEALLLLGDSLFVGGSFTKWIGDDFRHNLLVLDIDDTTWHDIGYRGGRVATLAYDETTQTLYAGGQFGSFGGDPDIGYIVKWDGENWSSLSGGDDGLDQTVLDIVIREGQGNQASEIIVGGVFRTVDGSDVQGLARYREGLGWDDMGADLDRGGTFAYASVHDLDLRFDRLYVGGSMDRLGSDTVRGLVYYDYDSQEWFAADGGPTDGSLAVFALDAFGGGSEYDLVAVGGNFSAINDTIAAENIAVYNVQTGEWITLGNGVNGVVNRLEGAVDGNLDPVIWAAGSFATSGADTVGRLAKYSTQNSWQAINGGVNGAVNDFIFGLGLSELYVGGEFSKTSDGTVVNGVARATNAGGWDGFGLGPNLPISDVFEDENGVLYLAGDGFTELANTEVRELALWDDSVYQPAGQIYGTSRIKFVRARNDTIYLGGQDITIDGVSYDYLAMYDGSQWDSLGGGVDHRILAMEFGVDGDLYVAGYFSTVDGSIASDGLARWNGSEWENIPVNLQDNHGYQEYVEDMAWDSASGNLYITGGFETVNGTTSKFVARYDGATWHGVGPVGVPISMSRHRGIAVAVDGAGRVFVGGDLGGSSTSPVYVWNGEWSVAGGYSLCFETHDMVSDGCNVYAAGPNGNNQNDCLGYGVARFNGGSWYELGSGVRGTPNAIALTERGLVVAASASRMGSVGTDLGIWTDLPDAAGAFTLNSVAPAAGDTLQYGKVFPVEYASDGVEQVQIEYSLDSGQTWTILHNRALPNHPLPWMIPDTNAEYCQLRLANAAAACDYSYGPFFSITTDPDLVVHRVTRYGGPYYREPFTMGFHQYSFENDSASCWPDTYYETIDYGQWPFPLSVVADNAINPDWGLFCDAMGEWTCYERMKPPRIVNPEKYIQWQIIKRNPWSGSCYGFTKSALLQFRRLELNSDVILPDIPYLYEENLTQFWRDMVNMYWIYQFGGKHMAYDIFHTGMPPSRTLDTLIKGMQHGEYPRGLSYARKALRPKDTSKTSKIPVASADSVKKRIGHNVMPYMIRNVPDSAGIWYVYVYDNNYADDEDLIVRIDANNETWSYNAYDYTDTDTTKGLRPTLPVSEFVGYATDPRLSKAPQETGPFIQLYTSSREYVTITDSLGNRLGKDTSSFYEEIPDAGPIVVTNPDWPWNHPIGYLVPEGSYQVEVSGFEDTLTELAWMSEATQYSYRRHGTDLSETDIIRVDSTFGLANPDDTPKNASLEAIFGDSIVGHFYYRLDSLDLVKDDSIVLAPAGDSSLTIHNYGSAKDYSLILWHTNSETMQYTQSSTQIQIDGDGTQQLVPNWATLADAPVKIRIDNDQDGTYEDSTMTDVALDADDADLGGLPENFHLGQNYPNPFNPTTTIEFYLPVRSQVKLSVYNILGREVRNLLDDELGAGSHSITWNGTGESGTPVATGVYFYRLVTDDYRASRKMLLLK